VRGILRFIIPLFALVCLTSCAGLYFKPVPQPAGPLQYRALGIPTRLAGGLVYMEGMGFLYHAWAESYAEGWISVDPTFNQTGVDATHIKLVEGDSWSTVLKVGNVVGRLKAKVIRFQSSCSAQNSLNHPSLRD